MDTLRYVYETSEDYQKIIPIHVLEPGIDKQNESDAAIIFTTEAIKIMKKTLNVTDEDPIIKYFQMAHDIYYPFVENKHIDEIVNNYTKIKKFIEVWEEFRFDFGTNKTKISVTNEFIQCINTNYNSLLKLQSKLRNNTKIKFCMRCLCTNGVEGLFGECRAILKYLTSQ